MIRRYKLDFDRYYRERGISCDHLIEGSVPLDGKLMLMFQDRSHQPLAGPGVDISVQSGRIVNLVLRVVRLPSDAAYFLIYVN